MSNLLKPFSFLAITPYKALLEENRWESLIEQFRQENYRLFQLASQSVFTVTLQAGLSALKTPYPFLNSLHFSFSSYLTIYGYILKFNIIWWKLLWQF